MPKRDFIFTDEAGEPAKETPYYIQGLLHITDEALKKINVHLGAFRYFGNISGELKSTKLNKLQKEKLLSILKFSNTERIFVRASAVYVDKKNYTGVYLHPVKEDGRVWREVGAATKFRHLIMRKLLEFHFQGNRPQSNEIELVIDRFHSDEEREQLLRNYLRTDRHNRLPSFLHIIQADSRYVELLQIADWVTGSVKEKFFVHPERDYSDLFQYLKVQQIIR